MKLEEYFKKVSSVRVSNVAARVESLQEDFGDVISGFDMAVESAIINIRDDSSFKYEGDDDLEIKKEHCHYLIHCEGDEIGEGITITDMVNNKTYTLGDWTSGYFDMIYAVTECLV